VHRVRFLHKAAVAKVDHSSEQQDAEDVAEHRDPQVELTLVDFNPEIVMNEHHRCGEGENEKSEVHQEVRYRGATFASTHLALQEAVLDEVIETPPPLTEALLRGTPRSPQKGAL
jgi:hypothetical protein